MVNIKKIFLELDKTDLKIMKIGLKICFGILLLGTFLLESYLFIFHIPFVYNLGFAIFKTSTYLAIEFIICGIVADKIAKEF